MTSTSKKIILVGHFAVGKSSLIKRFVHSKFSDSYLTTIGVSIEKKMVQVRDTQLTMIIWEIAGDDSIEKSNRAYFTGTHGIIYVYDLTRPATWENIEAQLTALGAMLPGAPIRVVGNKHDLVTERDRDEIVNGLSVETHFTSSAKTGEHVETLFLDLANALVK